MFEAVETLVDEHAELERKMSDPAVHSDQGLAKKLGQRYAEVSAIVKTYRDYQQATGDLEAAHEFAAEDPSFAAEIEALEPRIAELSERLQPTCGCGPVTR